MTEATILSEVRGALGVLTLNRPKAINALDVSMMDAVPAVLDAWRSDESVRAVALVGAGERGFCAGGDVRAVRQAHLDGDDAAASSERSTPSTSLSPSTPSPSSPSWTASRWAAGWVWA